MQVFRVYQRVRFHVEGALRAAGVAAAWPASAGAEGVVLGVMAELLGAARAFYARRG